MDHQRFDEVARLLGAGASRRRVLRGLAAGLLGLGGAGTARGRAGAQALPNGQACRQSNECTSGICSDGFCCDDLCIDNCEACNVPGSEGTCAPRPFGSLGDCPSPGVCRGGVSGGIEACCFPNGTVSPAENCCSGFGPQNVCCDTACDGPCETCTADGSFGVCTTIPGCGACGADGDCGAGELCCNGTCVARTCCGVGDADHCPEGTLCNENFVCEEVPADCAADADCPIGQICCGYANGGIGCVAQACCGVDDDEHCGAGKTCTAENTCEEPPVAGCEDDGDCGTGEICCAGTCRALACCIDDEDPNARCPEGTSCFEGSCDPVDPACGPAGDGCADDWDCCGHLVCRDGACAQVGVEVPVDTGGATTLPATGTGDDAGGGSGLLGLGLAAGAAAILAGKKLRAENGEA